MRLLTFGLLVLATQFLGVAQIPTPELLAPAQATVAGARRSSSTSSRRNVCSAAFVARLARFLLRSAKRAMNFLNIVPCSPSI